MAPVPIGRRPHPTNKRVGLNFLPEERRWLVAHTRILTVRPPLAEGVRKVEASVGHQLLLPSACLVSKKAQAAGGCPQSLCRRLGVPSKDRSETWAVPGWEKGASFCTDSPYSPVGSGAGMTWSPGT